MAFWSSETLRNRRNQILIDAAPFPEQVDCSAYTLRVGSEVYVTPHTDHRDPLAKVKDRLHEGEQFTIPPGQFAFLLTEEIVRLPSNAMAFISMKAKVKFKGLVNVSGFHVDPGYQGRLVFSVFNAGPTVVHLKQGQDCFLIWFASLSGDSKKNKDGKGNSDLPAELITAVSGELQSLEGLNSKIKDLEKRIEERLNRIEPKQAELITRLTIFGSIAAALLIGMVLYGIRGEGRPAVPAAPSAAVSAPEQAGSSPAPAPAEPTPATVPDATLGKGGVPA